MSILASKTAGRLGIPALLLFLLIGALAGSEGPGGIEYDDPASAQFVGVIALVLILFAGGLDTSWIQVKPVLLPGILLSTVGVAVTAAVMGLFLHYIMGLPLLFALLFGAVVSSTDAAAVFAVLRSHNINLKGRLQPLLELESGSNDPIAVLLTLGLTAALVGETTSWPVLGLGLVLQLVVGALIGFAAGRAIVWVINRINLQHAGLYPVLSLALVFTVYGVTTFARGNGFLAVYLAGLVVGNSLIIYRGSLIRNHDGLAWLMQIGMFLLLGLLVFPSHLPPVAGLGLAAAGCLVFIARPLAVFACLAPLRVPFREQILVSWVGLRGAVPIILSTFPLLAGIDGAELLFNVVFFAVVTSVIVQGPTIGLLARLLKLDAPRTENTSYPIVFEPTPGTKSDLFEVAIPQGAAAEGKRIADLNLPEGTLVVLINRGREFVVPRGNSTVHLSDRLLILADRGARTEIRRHLESPPPPAPD